MSDTDVREVSAKRGRVMSNVCAPFLSVAMLAEGGVFDRHFTTVWRWAKDGKLPEPDLMLAGKPLWAEATIREWAASKNLHVNDDAIDRICHKQLIR